MMNAGVFMQKNHVIILMCRININEKQNKTKKTKLIGVTQPKMTRLGCVGRILRLDNSYL